MNWVQKQKIGSELNSMDGLKVSYPPSTVCFPKEKKKSLFLYFILEENGKCTTNTEISHIADKVKLINGNNMKYKIYNSHCTPGIKVIMGNKNLHACIHECPQRHISIYKHVNGENSTNQEHGQPND